MPTTISERQNLGKSIEKLAAQRVLYSKAKLIFSIQVIASVPIVIAFSIVVNILKIEEISKALGFDKTHDLSIYLAAWGSILALLDLLLIVPYINGLKERAAKIQEYFDVFVLSLPWNEIMCGGKPDEEDIHEQSTDYLKNDANRDNLKDWYPLNVSGIHESVSRLICQRSNCVWDFNIRKKYRFVVLLSSTLLFIFLFVASLFADFSFQVFIKLVFLPFLPALLISIRQFQENGKAISRLEGLKKNIETTWRSAMSRTKTNVELDDLARKIQDQIYTNRKSNPLVFDKVYWRLRGKQESAMQYNAEQMLEEARTLGIQ